MKMNVDAFAYVFKWGYWYIDKHMWFAGCSIVDWHHTNSAAVMGKWKQK